jgi:hypothetical protein
VSSNQIREDKESAQQFSSITLPYSNKWLQWDGRDYTNGANANANANANDTRYFK